MWKSSAIVAREAGLVFSAVLIVKLTPVSPTWTWILAVVVCFGIAGIITLLHSEEVRIRWEIYNYLRTGRDPWEATNEVRFGLLYPRMRRLIDSRPPYDEGELGKIRHELNMLNIPWRMDKAAHPKYLSHIAKLSRQGKLEQARKAFEYLHIKSPYS